MSSLARFAIAVAALLAVLGAQVPQIAYVFPAGMRRGTSVEVTVGGRNLQGVTAAHFAHAGLTAEVLSRTRPMTGRERATAQQKLRELRDKRKRGKLTRAEEETARELRKKITESRRQVSPQLVETVVMRLVADADLEPGPLDLRLLAANGLSNPLRFVIGVLPERLEPARAYRVGDAIPVPVVVNGRILPREIDRFRFRVPRGARLVAVVEARSLIPFVADAVPGWFQAYLTLRAVDGTVLQTVDDCGIDPDPVLHWVAEFDGLYRLEIGDAICRGREDFVYRLTVGELPHVTSVFPLGAQAGQRSRAVLSGVNLESMVAEVDLTEQEPGVVTISAGDADADPLPFAVDRCREEREVESDATEPQLLSPPVVMNGIIDRPGDVDVFAVAATTGSRFVAEVSARRLGSPLDSLLRLVDPNGRELARCDDDPTTAAGLDTHAADSRLEFTIRGSGVHHLIVSDVQQKGSAEHAYRLYLGPPRPDFTVRVTPSAIAARAGGAAVVTVHVARRDGFTGKVELGLVDAPDGFRLDGGVVPARCDRVDVTVTAGDITPGRIVPLAIEGRARIGSREVTRRATPCDDRMQAFLNRHLVPAEQFLCAGRQGPRMVLPRPKIGRSPLRLRLGGTTTLVVTRPSRRARRDLDFVLRTPPAGIRITEVETKTGSYLLRIAVERRDDLRRLRGNLIIDVLRATPTPSRRGRAATIGTLPAVPFQIGT